MNFLSKVIFPFVVLVLGLGGDRVAADSLTPQKMQDPVVIDEKGITQLSAPDAMQSPDLKQFGPFSNFGAKRFWIDNWSKPSQFIAWHVSALSAGSYEVTFLINTTAGRQITVTGPENHFVF